MGCREQHNPFTKLGEDLFPLHRVPLPAADELHDFEPRARTENSLAPARLLDNAAVHFHRNAGGVQLQLLQQVEDGLPRRSCSRFAIDDDLDRHVWLTPFFSTNYSQI